MPCRLAAHLVALSREKSASLALANPAQSRIEIGVCRPWGNNWSATPNLLTSRMPYGLTLAFSRARSALGLAAALGRHPRGSSVGRVASVPKRRYRARPEIVWQRFQSPRGH